MTLQELEKEVFSTEEFRIRITHQDSGRKVRRDRTGLKGYGYQRKARSTWTVGEWKRKRFNRSCPEFDVEVLDVSSTPIPGQTKLENVRSTYN